jgi:hypothetical protein
MRRRLAIFSVIGATLAALAVGGIGVLAASAAPEGKQDICHATQDAKMPYVHNEPNKNGDLDGHTEHTGQLVTSVAEAQALKDQHIDWGDIIPPFTFGDPPQQFPGQNFTAEGQAIFENDCNFVTPTPPEQPPEQPPQQPPGQVTPQAPQAPQAPAAVVQVPRLTG